MSGLLVSSAMVMPINLRAMAAAGLNTRCWSGARP
jgi:hypothetical protein